MTLHKTLNSLIPKNAWESSLFLVAANATTEILGQHGTGTLLRIADDAFIVTAAHVVSLVKDNNLVLCTGVGNSFVQVYGNWCTPSDDVFDIAVLRLSKDLADKLENVPCIRLQDIDFSPDISKGVFCILGYPGKLASISTQHQPVLNIKPFQYITTAFTGKPPFLERYNEKYHLLFMAEEGGTDYEGNIVNLSDRDGIPLEIPKDLKGISGCSIWKLGNQDEPVTTWRQNKVKIVAVQNAVYSDSKLIKATRWSAVSTLIYEAYPDIRPAMKLWSVEY